MAVKKCGRCGRRLRGDGEGWTVEFDQGVAVGYACPDCKTPEEHAEAEINFATLDYATGYQDSEGRWRLDDPMQNDACVVCQKGTDTAVAFRGEAEWVIASIHVLGVPLPQAIETFRVAMDDSPRDSVHDGELQVSVRVCASCAANSPFSVGPRNAIPCFVQRPGD